MNLNSRRLSSSCQITPIINYRSLMYYSDKYETSLKSQKTTQKVYYYNIAHKIHMVKIILWHICYFSLFFGYYLLCLLEPRTNQESFSLILDVWSHVQMARQLLPQRLVSLFSQIV